MKHRKGNVFAVILIVGVLFLLLLAGLFLSFGILTLDWVFDEAVPELTNLGNVGDANLTEISGYTISPVNSIVQSFTWLGGLVYVFAFVGCLALAFAYRMTGGKWLMGLFLVCLFLLVVASIFISNIYEDFYNGNDDVGTRLKEQTLLSWLILYSPIVISIIGAISGIIMLTGENENAYV